VAKISSVRLPRRRERSAATTSRERIFFVREYPRIPVGEFQGVPKAAQILPLACKESIDFGKSAENVITGGKVKSFSSIHA
jgi:hypothetical protein